MSAAGFEQQLRRDMLQEQLQYGVASSAFVVDSEAQRIERLFQQRRDIGFATVAAAPLRDAIAVAETEVETFYKDNQSLFQVPEKVELEYLELNSEALQAEVVTEEEALREFFERNAGNYRVDEQRRVRHILLEVAQDGPQDAATAVLARASDLVARLRAGEAFAPLATELSEDVGSAANGGDLGTFGRGTMVPEFEKVAFSLQAGEISDPVKTEFGYHIIQVDEIKEAHGRTFDEARTEIEQAYRRERADALYYDRLEPFTNLTYEHDDALTAAAEQTGLGISTTAPMSHEELADQFGRRVADAAFAPTVLHERKNSDPIEIGETHTMVLRLKAHHPAAVPPLAEIHDAVRDGLIAERATATAKARGERLLERLRQGDPIAALMSDSGLTWETAEKVARYAGAPSREIVEAVFAAQIPAGAIDTYLGVSLPNGDFTVVRVSNIQDPAESELDAESLARTRLAAMRLKADQDWRWFVQGLKSRAKVVSHSERL
jgi:peptidyl-prolyl cis-trans isomerase D